jgi:CRISPR/Cas system-associated protein Cas10 (large subunit of type III CRISPR-Cas system)
MGDILKMPPNSTPEDWTKIITLEDQISSSAAYQELRKNPGEIRYENLRREKKARKKLHNMQSTKLEGYYRHHHIGNKKHRNEINPLIIKARYILKKTA